MIFDKFCGLVERHAYIKHLEPLARDCRVFVFPARAHEVLPKERENIDWFTENFFLPFQTVAIEDTASVVILHDIRPNMKGLDFERTFIECLPIRCKGDEGEFSDSSLYSEPMENIHRDLESMFGSEEIYSVTIGKIRFDVAARTSYLVTGCIDRLLICSKEQVIFEGDSLQKAMGLEAALRNAATAVEEVMYFNSPDRFVLEVAPLKMKRDGKKSPKIPRSQDRPLYHLLKPNEIRVKMGLPEVYENGRKAPIPHERRRHPRVLRSERFIHKRNETIIIPATWIGPSEGVNKNNRYRVMLDI